MTERDEINLLRAAGFGPGSGFGGPTSGGIDSAVATGPTVRSPGPVVPPEHEPTCRTCDEYSGSGMYAVCGVIETRLEAKAGPRGCCHGQVVAETARVQREGGCPAGQF